MYTPIGIPPSKEAALLALTPPPGARSAQRRSPHGAPRSPPCAPTELSVLARRCLMQIIADSMAGGFSGLSFKRLLVFVFTCQQHSQTGLLATCGRLVDGQVVRLTGQQQPVASWRVGQLPGSVNVTAALMAASRGSSSTLENNA